MTERDPFQNIIENMADEDYVTTEKDVDTYNPENTGCAARLRTATTLFAMAAISLLAWSLMLAIGIAVISENLYDAGATTIKIAFGESFWIAVGILVSAAAIRRGSS